MEKRVLLRLRAWKFGPWRWAEMVAIGLSLGLNAVQFAVMLVSWYRFERQHRRDMYQMERDRALGQMEIQRYNALAGPPA